MWSCVTHCAVLDWNYCEFRKLSSKTSAGPQFLLWNCHSWSHIVQSNLMYENKGFLSNVVGDFKEQKIFFSFFLFECIVCLLHPLFLSLFFFLFFFLHKKQIMRNCGFLCPCCLSLWVCHSTRKKVNQAVSGYCLTWHWFLLESLKKTLHTKWDEIFVCGRMCRFHQTRSFFCQFTDIIGESIYTSFLPNHCILPNVVF